MIIVKENADGSLVESIAPANNILVEGVGANVVNHSWSDVVRCWSDAALASTFKLYRVAPSIVPPGKIVTATAYQKNEVNGEVEQVFTLADLPVVIPTITRRQLILGLMQYEIITPAEAMGAAQNGLAPAAVAATFDALAEPARTAAYVTWASMSIAERNNPLVGMLAQSRGMTSAEVDQFFLAAAAL